MLEDLSHHQELPHRGRAFDCEAGEIGALRFDPGQQFAQGGDCAAARQVDIRRITHEIGDHVGPESAQMRQAA